MRKNKEKKNWPKGSLWPEPIWNGDGDIWDLDLAEMQELDEEGQDLLEIKDYMDDLVEEGRLNPDYSLNEDYEEEDDFGFLDEQENDEEQDSVDGYEEENDGEEFVPEKGSDFWDDGFDLEAWEFALSEHINLLKIEICDPETDPVSAVYQVTGYTFINENLLRQAFTRHSFGIEYDLGDCEELEFYGDAALNTVVSRELYERFSDSYFYTVENPIRSRHNAGELSRIRTSFISRDHLAAKASEHGLDRYILYGAGEQPSDSAREDMMEALIGAVAVDSDWNWSVLADVVDRLICLQLDQTDELLKESSYERLNRWHQKHFGRMPEYTIDVKLQKHGKDHYDCILRYLVPENDKGIWTSQLVREADALSRSAARESAAELAIRFLINNGLWINLRDAGITPDFENSINQLQELFQKKYVDAAPEYEFEERNASGLDEWHCSCTCGGIQGYGTASAKTKAKKKAAYMVLVRLMKSAGLATEEMEHTMWSMWRNC